MRQPICPSRISLNVCLAIVLCTLLSYDVFIRRQTSEHLADRQQAGDPSQLAEWETNLDNFMNYDDLEEKYNNTDRYGKGMNEWMNEWMNENAILFAYRWLTL